MVGWDLVWEVFIVGLVVCLEEGGGEVVVVVGVYCWVVEDIDGGYWLWGSGGGVRVVVEEGEN